MGTIASSVSGEFPAQLASNAESFSIWWRHHDLPGPIVTMSNIVFKYTNNQNAQIRRHKKHPYSALGLLLLTRINFNRNMDRYLYLS